MLLDAFKFRSEQGRPIDPGAPEWYTVEDLEATAEAQGVELKPGDLLLVRTGWLQHYLKLSPEEKRVAGTEENLVACGIDSAREMAAWLWDHRVAAVATDGPGVEPCPFDLERSHLHHRTLVLLGMPLGEQFNLEELAADCAQDGVYECMLVSVPCI